MSAYVTDTHSLVFYITRHFQRLSRRALQAFQKAESGRAFIYIPAVVLWEISRLERDGVIQLTEPFEDWCNALFAAPCFECVPLDEQVIVASREYRFSRDLFDAAIVGTARLKDVPLITNDAVISDSGIVEIYW